MSDLLAKSHCLVMSRFRIWPENARFRMFSSAVNLAAVFPFDTVPKRLL